MTRKKDCVGQLVVRWGKYRQILAVQWREVLSARFSFLVCWSDVKEVG